VIPRRRRSLLEDDELSEIGGRDESSGSDVCERCGRSRDKHVEGGDEKCEEFVE